MIRGEGWWNALLAPAAGLGSVRIGLSWQPAAAHLHRPGQRSGMDEKINPNPEVFKAVRLVREDDGGDDDDGVPEPFDTQEIYDLVRDISDPEHPHTLEELKVMQPDGVVVDNEAGLVSIRFTPTIPHCSMSTLIGLCIRVKLLRSIPSRFKVDVTVTPGSHASEHQVNKQLNDKERVAAALENSSLLEVVNRCLAHAKLAAAS